MIRDSKRVAQLQRQRSTILGQHATQRIDLCGIVRTSVCASGRITTHLHAQRCTILGAECTSSQVKIQVLFHP